MKVFDEYINEKGLTSSEIRRRKREWFQNYKKTLYCVKCFDKRHYTLCFHHIDPSRKFKEVPLLVSNYGIETTKKEIKKCIVLCQNCHKDFHYQEKFYNINLEDYLK